MKWVVLAESAERGAELADQTGIEAENAVVITTIAACTGLEIEAGDEVVVDNPGFWLVKDWPYIMSAVRIINAEAGNSWTPRFT